jgi:hypothetical protein
MNNIEITLFVIGTVSLIASYFLNKIDPNKWVRHEK